MSLTPMSIVWRPRAADDFERLIATVCEANTVAGSRDKSAVENKILQLVRFDQLGRKTRRIGVREMPVEGTPYVVVNRRRGGDILIMRIFHNGKATLF